MSLEQAIHDHWANDAALTTLVPAARFVTGYVQGELSSPYATLARESTVPKVRTSDRTIDDVLFRLDIWSDDLDEAKQIAALVTARFDRQSFAADGCSDDDCTVIRMRKTNQVEQQDTQSSAWQITLTFLAVAARAIGA